MLNKYIMLTLLISLSNFLCTSEKSAQQIYTKKRKADTQTAIITPVDQVVLTYALKVVDNIRNKKPHKSYYNSQRSRNVYDSSSTELFKLSRSKLKDFLNCQRCFFIDRKKGTGHVPGYPFSLNSAVDALLKKEFDEYRQNQEAHPYCIDNNINAIPFQHPLLESWRNSLYEGVQAQINGTNIVLTGGIDDLWINPTTNELIVVDYKATSKKGDVSLDADWQDDYKQQIEIYQWLLRQQIGTNLDSQYTISDTAYFVYCNGDAQAEQFSNRLNFKVSLLPYKGDCSWVEPAVIAAYHCLQSEKIPASSSSCDHCKRFQAVSNHLEKEKSI